MTWPVRLRPTYRFSVFYGKLHGDAGPGEEDKCMGIVQLAQKLGRGIAKA